ncbi:MAG: thioredoxin domain-containing protein, partial [Alcanivorax sp.]|nr:thioredoxin domain-containing protein [Alcanivorax sp.]
MNRLADESSPYLRQHATNPVDWFPWGDEAFEKARRENKPIFLSVGYSSCHWCHVMEHESFEHDDVAKILNDLYIPVKVDREERPDIDQIYMNATQAMTGRGGWPNSLWLDAEGRPWYCGTYFPREDHGNQPG